MSDHATRPATRSGERTPAGDPVFVGVTNGGPVRLLYDVEVYPDTEREPQVSGEP